MIQRFLALGCLGELCGVRPRHWFSFVCTFAQMMRFYAVKLDCMRSSLIIGIHIQQFYPRLMMTNVVVRESRSKKKNNRWVTIFLMENRREQIFMRLGIRWLIKCYLHWKFSRVFIKIHCSKLKFCIYIELRKKVDFEHFFFKQHRRPWEMVILTFVLLKHVWKYSPFQTVTMKYKKYCFAVSL